MILSIILIFLLWFIAAASNAVMDILQHKYKQSIFSNYNRQYWDPIISWANKYKVLSERIKYKWNFYLFKIDKPVFLTDAWHLFQSIMIVSLAISVLIALTLGLNILPAFLILNGLGLTWNKTFVLFYHKLLNKNFKYNLFNLFLKKHYEKI